MRDFCCRERMVEEAQYYGRREAKFMKSWYITEGKVLEKACTISVGKND